VWLNRSAVEDNLENSRQIKGPAKGENERPEGVLEGLPEAPGQSVPDASSSQSDRPNADPTIGLRPADRFDFSSTSSGSREGLSGEDAHLPEGTVIGEKYLILGFLGAGGMSAVYKAKHVLTGKIVALKVMHGRLLNDSSSFRRFHQEAIASSRLNHPNAISVSDMGMTGSQPYLVMDFIDGRSLALVIREEGRLSVERALKIFIQAALGLGSAHKLGIIHRDLKPSNIMLVQKPEGENEIVKLVDFGIAKIISQEGESQKLTATGEVFGSPLYMSPEQCEGRSLDARSDMYSMGCLMFEALTGRTPFCGENVMSTLLKHLNEAPPLLTDLDAAPVVQSLLNGIISKALSKDPEKRQKDMFELVEDLNNVLEVQLGLKSAPHLSLTVVAKQFIQKTVPTLTMTVGILALLVVLSIGLFALLSSPEFGLGDNPSLERRIIFPTPVNIAKSGQLEADKSFPLALKQFLGLEDQISALKKIALRAKVEGRYSDAIAAFEAADGALYRSQLGDSLEAAEVQMNIADCRLYLGDYKSAISSAQGAIAKLQGVGDPIKNWTYRCNSVIAYSNWRLGDYDKARALYQDLSEVQNSSRFGLSLNGQIPADFAFDLTANGLFFAHAKPNDASDRQKTLKIYQVATDRLLAVTSASRLYERAVTFNLGVIKNAIGLINERDGREEEANDDFQSAINCFKELKGDNDLALASTLFNQSDLQWKRRNFLQALQLRATARAIWQRSKNLDR
jgi:serine/threonine protein kinase